MKFIKPKNEKLKKPNWELPQKTIAIVKHYASYTGYSEEEVLSKFLENILDDPDFIHHIKKKTNNKRIVKELGLDEDDLQTTS